MSLLFGLQLPNIKFATKKIIEEDDNDNLRKEIFEIKRQLRLANQNFDCAVEKENVEYYTYLMKAFEVKYRYLLKIAREKGIFIS